MSAFEITVTPTRTRGNRKSNESREPTMVIMAPFTGKSIVQFEDVPVKKTAKRLLRVINPSESEIEVKLTKLVQAEHNLSVEWTQGCIAAQSEVTMEIVWSPDIEVACKDSLQLTDNRNFRKDVTIILKSKGNKVKKAPVRKFPTVSSSVKTLRLKSPTGNTGALRNAKLQRKHILQQKSASEISVPQRRQHRPSLPLGERNKPNKTNNNLSPMWRKQPTEEVDDLKENVSPTTPVLNVMNYIDRLKFTPASNKRSALDPCAGIDSLASLPTPKNSTPCLNRDSLVPPRRLLNSEVSAPVDEILLLPQIVVQDYSKGVATPIINKTFDVKRNETLDISASSHVFEVSLEEPLVVMNKTTTIATNAAVGTLAMIHEEEENSLVGSLQQTYSKLSAENLKRDIHLVGTPLHKQCESMKDLLFKSPNSSKMGNQGSLPNLNEMEQIRSIEQNRYFYDAHAHKRMSVIHEQSERGNGQHNTSESNASLMLNTSHLAESTMFVQSEICAASSRFNMHEIGLKTSRQNSPIHQFKQPTPVSKTGAEMVKKRTLYEISVSDTNSNDSLTSSRKSLKISPPKRQRFDGNCSVRNTTRNASASSSGKSWSHTLPPKLKLLRRSTPNAKAKVEEPPIRLYDADLYTQTFINPDPFAATTTCDPFLASTMYLDERAVDKHITDFKKWLNALVSIPAELDANCDANIDVAKLFNEVRHKELTLAPNKEENSLHYHTKFRWESLRRAAVELYLGEEMRVPCSKVASYVHKNAIRIRGDRNLHLDVVTQRTILELLLCFNPLWLRLGLEVVYGEKIQINSNSDIYGLSTFIINRLFRDKFLEQKYNRAYSLSEEYADHIKKFTLQKLLLLLLFLDKAKQKRIVKHNPCLFVTKSPYKDTRSILLRVSSELIANMGDVTRELKRLGYVLEHKQSFIDEFDYAFKNVSVDLRDGIRLTRVMEIILLREDLTSKLRVPAISRLQRIHNVNLALRALAETDFELKGDITAASIVDGHREKTLSLLWQIIYMFRSPKFHAAATVLQKWWRSCWLRVYIARRIRQKAEERRNKAATVLQAVYRGHVARKRVQQYRVQANEAAVVLQSHVRGFLVRVRQAKLTKFTVRLQRQFRARHMGKHQRALFLLWRKSAIVLQRFYRSHLWTQEEKLRRAQAAQCIQRYWRGYVQMKATRANYKYQYGLIVLVQCKWRARKCMQQQRASYVQQRGLVINLQRRYRALREMRVVRLKYFQLRQFVCCMQQRRRALVAMRKQRQCYLQQLEAIRNVQLHWRATLEMRLQRATYLKTHESICQLQRRWRATLLMQREQRVFIRTRQLLITAQRKWRATLEMRSSKVQYQLVRQNIVNIQRLYRSKLQMRREHNDFKELKCHVIKMQKRYKGKLLMLKTRAEYRRQHQAARLIQQYWRGYKRMRFDRAKFQGTRAAVLCLQQHIRCYLHGRQVRSEFVRARQLIVWVQQRYRATLTMRQVRAEYLQERAAIICVQRRYRAQLLQRKQRAIYVQQRQAAIHIQRWFGSVLRMRCERASFRKQRDAAMRLQLHWRAVLKTRETRAVFKRTLQHIVAIQRKWRATLEMRRVQRNYQLLRSSTLVLQRHWRSRQTMLYVHSQYLLVRSLVVCLQRKYRARRLMLQERSAFLKLRHYTLHLQQKWRGKSLMLQQRTLFICLRTHVVGFQAHARGTLARRRFQALMTPAMMDLLRQKKAVKIIQRFWRGYRVRRASRDMRLQLIRKNIAELKKSSNIVNSIRCKVQDAVRLLRGRFSASEALHVLIRLERLSRMVPHLLMLHSSFISTFSYGIMAQAIRSEVDKQLIEHCSRIILNLARYNSTTANTFQKSGLVTIAQMLLRWCDKDCDIFNTLCTLIWIFAHCPKKRQIIRDYMTTTDTIYMVRETKKLVARKEKMKQNVRKPSNLSAGVGWSVQLPPQQQHQTASFPQRALPSLNPDYGVIRGKPYTFVSSVFAFDTVLSKLGIHNI